MLREEYWNEAADLIERQAKRIAELEGIRQERAATVEECAKVAEELWPDSAALTEWGDGVNAAKNGIAKAIRSLLSKETT